jgi:hypothetical protein
MQASHSSLRIKEICMILFGRKQVSVVAFAILAGALISVFTACDNPADEKIIYKETIVEEIRPVYSIALEIADNMTAAEIAQAIEEGIAATQETDPGAPVGAGKAKAITLRPSGIALDNFEALATLFTAIRDYWVYLDLSDLEGDTWEYNAAVAAVSKGRVLSLTLGEEVTTVSNGTIATDAFRGFFGLKSFTAEGLATLGTYAFYNCYALVSVDLPVAQTIGNYAFSGCTALTNVGLPAAQTIGSNAFGGCSALTSAILPEAKTIGNNAFSFGENNRSSLYNVYLPKAETIGDYAFFRNNGPTSISLPMAKTIGESAFMVCTSLQSVYLPMVETIGSSAFYNCPLTSMTISAMVGVNGSTFYSNTSIRSFTVIGEGSLSTIDGGKGLVENSKKLIAYFGASGNVTLPDITSVEEYAFSDCAALTVSLPLAETIGNYAFSGCTALTSVNLPLAETIGNMALQNCVALTSVDLSEAKTIGNMVFYGCTSLKSLELPKAETLGNETFRNCTALESLEIKSVKTLGNQVFNGTGEQALVITMGLTAPTVGTMTFTGITAGAPKTVTVKVPASATGYGASPTDTTTVCWGNGFRGRGWTGTAFTNATVANMNANVTLNIEVGT